MEENIDIRFSKIFKTELFNKCFQELFSPKENKGDLPFNEYPVRGIMTNIIEDYTIIPAKGGSSGVLREYSDITYFVHVLNASVLGGKFLERYMIGKGADLDSTSPELEKYVRLFFASVCFHDSDKLFHEGFHGALNLSEVLETNKQDIIKICSYYLDNYGNNYDWWDDLCYLILRTENRTMEQANTYKTNKDQSLLATLSLFTQLGDQVGGIKKSCDDNEVFLEISRILETEPFNEKIHSLKFADLPQVLLLDSLKEIARKEIGKEDIIVETQNSIIYAGNEISKQKLDNIKNKFNEKMTREYEEKNSRLKMFDSFKPGSNSLKLGFAELLEPTPLVIMEFLDYFNGKLLIYLGKKEIDSIYSGLDIRIRLTGFPIEMVKDKLIVKYERADVNEADSLTDKNDLCVLVSAARRIEYEKDENIFNVDSKNQNLKSIVDGYLDNKPSKDLIFLKTLFSIAYAVNCAKQNEDLKSYLDQSLKNISYMMKKSIGTNLNPNYSEFFDRALGKVPVELEIPDKSDSCIQCGAFSNISLKDENVFGYNATAGTGLKVSSLVYGDKFNGRICIYCNKENLLRKKEMGGDRNKSLSLITFFGDYLVPVKVSDVLSLIDFGVNPTSPDEVSIQNDKLSLKMRIGKTQKELNFYTIFFIEKPKKTKTSSEKDKEFNLIYGILKIIRKTGLKIKLSPLSSNVSASKPIFSWENSRSWISELELNEVRLDELESKLNLLQLIDEISRINPKRKGVTFVISNLLRSKRGLYTSFWGNTIASGKIQLDREIVRGIEEYVKKYSKEEYEMNMKELVKEACCISTKGPKTNNDHTEIIRLALEIYIRNLKEEDAQLSEIISGRIWERAKRMNYARKEALECSLRFSSNFVKLMRLEFKNSIPGPEHRKDIIAQFAILYNVAKWDELKAKKINMEVEKNEQ